MTASPPSVLPDERLAAERLDALAHAQAITDKALPRVLFVCSHNAGRSQMAAALLGLRAGGRVTVSSAGTDPAAEVEPEVAQVLHDAGRSAGRRFPQAADRRGDPGRGHRGHHGLRRRLPGRARPPLPGLARRRPGRGTITAVRAIRDEIDAHITELLTSLPGA
ncbi:arsenate-mycothiol transferase ArsC [Streptomyces sp. NEAU-174]|uniref:arsenate-mycothiol transferase ArsC n=1 Tax=Streptomyces sp. NEAU-174 TaxID=3458254 RepID=UPI004044A167